MILASRLIQRVHDLPVGADHRELAVAMLVLHVARFLARQQAFNSATRSARRTASIMEGIPRAWGQLAVLETTQVYWRPDAFTCARLLNVLAVGNLEVEQGRVKPATEVIRRLRQKASQD